MLKCCLQYLPQRLHAGTFGFKGILVSFTDMQRTLEVIKSALIKDYLRYELIE